MPPAPASLPVPPPALPSPVPGPGSAPLEERPQRPVPELPSLPMPPAPTAASIERHLPAGTRDRAGWAQDIAVAFAALRLPASAQNICSAVAITEQESLFVEDPPVPGLARIVWKEIEQRRQRYGIPRMLLDAALLKNSPNGQSYRRRIDTLRTEKQMNALYQDMISELPYGRTLLAERNPVRTGGPMQVSIAFAEAHARQHPYPYARRGSIRDEVFTRRGGMYFGIAILLDYPAPYDEPLYRFADFNAGRYSSRNAAFQLAVARLSGQPLAPDGDLLRYRDGEPSEEASATLRALERMSSALSMSRAEIQRDLRLEKTPEFGRSELHARVFALAERRGSPMARAAVPRIELRSPKITRKLTTEWFARRVDWRYRNCLARNGG